MNRCLNGVIVLVLALVMSVYAPTRAEAGDHMGCYGKHRWMADQMVYDHYEQHPSRLPIKLYQERLTATVMYNHCLNGKRSKVKPAFMTWCYSHLDGDWPIQFDGFKGDVYFADQGHQAGQRTVKIANNRQVQNCVTTTVNSPWLRINEHAGWSATGYYVRHAFPDWDFQFKDANGAEFHLFLPENDVALGDWQ